MNYRKALAAVCACLLLPVTGCHRAVKVAGAAAPPAPPAVGPVMVSVPPPTHHDQQEITVSTPSPAAAVQETPRRPTRVRRSPAAAQPGTAPTSTPTATATAPPAISLGELSAGGAASSGLRQQTADLLRSQQQRLDTADRGTVAAHPTEIAQAKTFLQRATESWNAADYEGAHTLAVKAKVLLDDLKR